MFSGKRLKQKRIEKGMTQAEIADIIRINRSSYNSWESGRAKPNQKNLSALASILGVSDTYFESEYDIMNHYLQLNPMNQQKADTYV